MTSRFKTITFVLVTLYFLANGLISCSRARLLHKGYEDSKISYSDKGQKKLARYLRRWDSDQPKRTTSTISTTTTKTAVTDTVISETTGDTTYPVTTYVSTKTTHLKRSKSDTLIQAIYGAYKAFYNPYDFERYSKRPPHAYDRRLVGGYLVIQASMQYTVTRNDLDSIADCANGNIFSEHRDLMSDAQNNVMTPFAPPLDFDSVLYLTASRKEELVNFLFKRYGDNTRKDFSGNRRKYLESGGLKYYKDRRREYDTDAYQCYLETPPFVHFIVVNEQLDKALIFYQFDENYLNRAYLENENGTWQLKQICL